MEIKDMLGLGKVFPIDKLIDLVSNSVGRISKPYFDKKDINTKAYEIEKLAEARAKEMKIIANAVKENFKLTGGIEYKEERIAISSPIEIDLGEQPNNILIPEIQERTKQRIDFQQTKKQLNIESITAIAAEELKDEPPITDEPVDEDWTTRFFNIVEEISNEDMQALWGRILAGEVKEPKSYSLRTLELIRNLSKKEADTFMKVAKFSIKSGNGHYVFKGNDENKLSKDFKINYEDIALLTEIGLIQPGDFVNHQFFKQTTDRQRFLIAGNIILFVNVKAETPTIMMPVNVFSSSGNQLLKLVKSIPPFEYLEYFSNSIKSENVDIKYAHILDNNNDNITHTNPLQEFK
jgi:uncharacterized repeat protein (TIGR03899 family)